MESQIRDLLEKYWQGETTIKEESILKDYFKNSPNQTIEGQYFNKIGERKKKFSQKRFAHPGMKFRRSWLSAAAALIIAMISIPFIVNNNKQTDQFAIEDPMKAFEVTRASLKMVSEGLNKGKTYSNELVKFEEAKKRIETN